MASDRSRPTRPRKSDIFSSSWPDRYAEDEEPKIEMRAQTSQIPLAVWNRVDAWARLRGQSRSQVVTEALEAYFKAMTPAHRRLIAQAIKLVPED